MQIDIGETHIRLTSDVAGHNLNEYIYQIRADLKSYIAHNEDFLLSLKPLRPQKDNLPVIVEMMYESSFLSGVGPMACVAGTISELSVDYLIQKGSKFSIVENGGDIALVNDRKVLCGIYSNNEVLGNEIAFEIKARKRPLGICSSSGRIGHSLSFGQSDSVTVIADSASLGDGLATRIANDVIGPDSESRVMNGLATADELSEFFRGVLIISDDNVGSVGRLPKIVETSEFDTSIK